MSQKKNDPVKVISLSDGRKVSTADLPRAVYTMSCGHKGATPGVMKNDVVFCDHCQTHTTVVKTDVLD